jgi:hypothetical protein
VERVGLIRFLTGKRYCSSRKIKDDSGNELWSINVVVGVEDQLLVEPSTRLQGYKQGQRPECTRPSADEQPNSTEATSEKGDACE